MYQGEAGPGCEVGGWTVLESKQIAGIAIDIKWKTNIKLTKCKQQGMENRSSSDNFRMMTYSTAASSEPCYHFT